MLKEAQMKMLKRNNPPLYEAFMRLAEAGAKEFKLTVKQVQDALRAVPLGNYTNTEYETLLAIALNAQILRAAAPAKATKGEK